MLFLTDTCFWDHAKELATEGLLDIRPIMQKFRWGYPKSVWDEIIHWELDDFVPRECAMIVPIIQSELETFSNEAGIAYLDLADQEIVYSAKKDGFAVLSDDGGLVMECQGLAIEVLRLPDFIIFLVHNSMLEKREATRCIKFWEKSGRYALKYLKNYHQDLQM